MAWLSVEKSFAYRAWPLSTFLLVAPMRPLGAEESYILPKANGKSESRLTQYLHNRQLPCVESIPEKPHRRQSRQGPATMDEISVIWWKSKQNSLQGGILWSLGYLVCKLFCFLLCLIFVKCFINGIRHHLKLHGNGHSNVRQLRSLQQHSFDTTVLDWYWTLIPQKRLTTCYHIS